MTAFNPNLAAPSDSGIFGLPFSPEQSTLVILPVPWEATVSYGSGAADGPAAVLEASRQVDLFDHEMGRIYEAGIAILPTEKNISAWNDEARRLAKPVIDAGGDIGTDKKLRSSLDQVNALSGRLNGWVEEQFTAQLESGKIAALLGGDHSTPFGAIAAVKKRFPAMGILHVDAHADLRKAYEGFTFSHASIMYNVMEMLKVEKLTQVGLRDICEEEVDFIASCGKRMSAFYDSDLRQAQFAGKTWKELCDGIVSSLPKDVYVSFDIDGLDPSLCPHTGTPVPGGLSFNEANFLIRTLVESGRRIVGFDLNEVSPADDDWNQNVGARMLYKLCGWTLKSQK